MRLKAINRNRLVAAAVLLTAGSTLSGCGAAPPKPAHPLSLADAKALAAERGTLVLVDFFTDW